jgi:hypothetical protein
MSDMAKRVVARFLGLAMEHDTPEALKKYLKEHPDADKSKHTVKKQEDKDEGGKDEGGKDADAASKIVADKNTRKLLNSGQPKLVLNALYKGDLRPKDEDREEMDFLDGADSREERTLAGRHSKQVKDAKEAWRYSQVCTDMNLDNAAKIYSDRAMDLARVEHDAVFEALKKHKD